MTTTTTDGVGRLVERVNSGAYGLDPAEERIAVAFTTSQAVRHRAGPAGTATRCSACGSGPPWAPARSSPARCRPVRWTTASARASPSCWRTRCRRCGSPRWTPSCCWPVRTPPRTAPAPVPIPAGSSLDRSRARARAVVGLVPAEARRVLVVGVVNSLLEQLRERGTAYLPCDLKGGRTEWGEPVRTEAELDDCDALLVSGMTLGNGSFETFAEHARQTGKPLVMFAQTGSAVLPRLLGDGVTAVSAEPYPFFWLDGGPGTIHLYGGAR